MNWFYVTGGQQAGPVDDAQLEGLVRSGQVLPETLVWHEGMPNWLPYGQVRPAPQAPVAPPPMAAPPAPGPIAPATGPNEVICAECGKVFPIENTIQLGGSRVCAVCKPLFMQRIHEGAIRQAPFAPGTLTEAKLLAQDYEVDIGGCFQRGWEAFKADPGTFIGVSLLVYLAIFAANLIPYLSMITGILLMGPLTAGLWIFTLKKLRGQPTTIGDGFSGFGPKFWQYFLVHLIRTLIASAVLIVVIFGLVIAAISMGAMNHNFRNGDFPPGLIVLLVVGGLAAWASMVYFQVCWLFALPLAADKGLEFWPALQLSRRMVMKHWWMTFWLTFVAGMLVLVGFLACGVGVLVAGPVAFAMLTAHYDRVFGKLAAQPS
jgi:GYF domain 2/Protein of unknown function (DUF975)